MATSVAMPKQGNTVEECLLVHWLVKEGDAVAVGTPLCSIETDKAAFDVESPAEGVLLKIFRQAGELIPVLTSIAAIGNPGEDVSALAPDSVTMSSTASTDANIPMTPAPSGKPDAPSGTMIARAAPAANAPLSPRAKKLAESLAVNPSGLAGSGIGGRIIGADIQAAAEARGLLTPAARMAAEAGWVPSEATGLGGRVRLADMVAPIAQTASVSDGVARTMEENEAPPIEIPYRGIRKLIGDRMRDSLQRHAQLTLNRGVDASQLLSMRALFKESPQDLGLAKVTLNDLICWTVARTLPNFPEVNAIFDYNAEKTIQYRRVNLAVAVDTPRGLMVPVICDAHRMSLKTFSQTLARYADQAKKGSIDPDLLRGGTFTVTNLGALGIESFTPVLNSPQVAILGVCSITDRPIQEKDRSIRLAPTLGLSLTIDHQVVDGAPGARFLQGLAQAIGGIKDILAIQGVSREIVPQP